MPTIFRRMGTDHIIQEFKKSVSGSSSGTGIICHLYLPLNSATARPYVVIFKCCKRKDQ